MVLSLSQSSIRADRLISTLWGAVFTDVCCRRMLRRMLIGVMPNKSIFNIMNLKKRSNSSLLYFLLHIRMIFVDWNPLPELTLEAGSLLEGNPSFGDSGFMKLSDDLRILVCVSRVMEPSRYLSHERIYLTAQLHAGHIHTPYSSSVVRRFKEEFFYLFSGIRVRPFKVLWAATVRTGSRVLYQMGTYE